MERKQDKESLDGVYKKIRDALAQSSADRSTGLKEIAGKYLGRTREGVGKAFVTVVF